MQQNGSVLVSPKRIRLEIGFAYDLVCFYFTMISIRDSVAVSIMMVNCSCRSDCSPQSYLLEWKFLFCLFFANRLPLTVCEALSSLALFLDRVNRWRF